MVLIDQLGAGFKREQYNWIGNSTMFEWDWSAYSCVGRPLSTMCSSENDPNAVVWEDHWVFPATDVRRIGITWRNMLYSAHVYKQMVVSNRRNVWWASWGLKVDSVQRVLPSSTHLCSTILSLRLNNCAIMAMLLLTSVTWAVFCI